MERGCFFFECEVKLCVMKCKDSKAIYIVITSEDGMLARKKLLAFATLGSSSFCLAHQRWFHSHCLPVIFFLLRATMQVLKFVLIRLCIKGGVSIVYTVKTWISRGYSKD